MAFTNERDKKGRLSFVYNSDDSAETIREIVEDCQKKVIGACPHAYSPPCMPLVPRPCVIHAHAHLPTLLFSQR